MIDKIVAKLKTGTVTNVVPYGAASLPSAPYVVVKEEPNPSGSYTRYRCIAHFLPGQVIPLRTYVRKELIKLLDGVKLTGSGGNVNMVESFGDLGSLVVSNDDGTISQERAFRIWDLF